MMYINAEILSKICGFEYLNRKNAVIRYTVKAFIIKDPINKSLTYEVK